MKHQFSKLLPAMVIILLLWSCTKSELATPPTPVQSASDESASSTAAMLSPGLYRITRFVDDGRNETAEFKGYTFNFQADGDLIARTNEGERVEGEWKLNNNGTRMEIKISGKGALDGIDDDDWIVVSLTGSQIIIRNLDPDRVVFTKI